MGKFNIDNDHEFVLESEEIGSVTLEQDPLNWNTDSKEYTYDKIWGGTLAKVNTSLEFAGKGYRFIRSMLLGFGFGKQATVTKRIKDDTKLGEDWRIGYQSYIDLNKAEFDRARSGPVAKVQFTQGGLYDEIKARYSDKFDLVSEVDANGNAITPLSTINESVAGREIFRRSVAAAQEGVRVDHDTRAGDRDNATAVPFEFSVNSDEVNIQSVRPDTIRVGYNNDNYASGSVGHMMFISSDRYRDRRLNGKVSIKIADEEPGTISFQEVRYRYDSQKSLYRYVSKKTLASFVNPTFGSVNTYIFDNYRLELEKDEGVTYAMYSRTKKRVSFDYVDTYLEITEDDSFVPTKAKSILPFEMLDRLLEKITGKKGLLVSDTFGRTDIGYPKDGEWSMLGVSSGFWARGFDIGNPIIDSETGQPYPPKQFNISLKDLYESFYMVAPLMAAVETINGKERFRVERYEYSHQDFVGIRMGRQLPSGFQHIPASKAVETVLEENIFTSVTIGYLKGGSEYGEVSGLSAPHGQAQYSLSKKTMEPNEYSKVSQIRGDLEGYDLARRRQAVEYPDTDTTYDQDLFFRHYRRSGDKFVMRKWQDDMTERPKGAAVYSPDTMGNLLLTPFRCLLRHGRILATSEKGRRGEKVQFISSNCFSSFSTTKIDGDTVQEDGFVLNGDLGKPYINGFMLSFEGKVFQSMIDEIEGFTLIGDKRYPNWYGLFEVEVDGNLEYGRLIKSDISGSGKHEIALI